MCEKRKPGRPRKNPWQAPHLTKQPAAAAAGRAGPVKSNTGISRPASIPATSLTNPPSLAPILCSHCLPAILVVPCMPHEASAA